MSYQHAPALCAHAAQARPCTVSNATALVTGSQAMALGGVPWGMEERDTAGREPRVSVDSVQAAPVHTPVASASDRGAHSHDSELQALRDQVALLRHHNWVLREQHARLWHHMSALERTRQQLQLQLQIEAAVFGLALPTPPDYSAVYWAAAQPTVMATPCNTAGWGTGVGLVGAGSPAAALAPCSGACVYSAAAATNGVYTAAGPPGASPSPSAPMDDTEGDLSEWEQHLVDVFVAKVRATS